MNSTVGLKLWKTSRDTSDGTTDYDNLFSLSNASINAVNNSTKTFYLYVCIGYIPVRRAPLVGEQIGWT